MRIELALNKQRYAVRALRAIFSTASIQGFSSLKLSSEVENKVTDTLAGCPQWVRSFVSGYEECLRDNMRQRDMVYGVLVGEEFYSSHSGRTDYYELKGLTPSKFNELVTANSKTAGHYWKVPLDNGRKVLY